MRHTLVLLTLFLLSLFFLAKSEVKTPLAALEQGPIPKLPARREAALSPLGLNQLLDVKLPFKEVAKGVKVLFSTKEQDELKDRVTRHDGIDDAARALSRVNAKFSEREERGRMEAVDFLVQSIIQAGNDPYALGAVTDVLLSDKIFQTEDVTYRKSLVGDRVELYEALTMSHPQVAEEVYRRAQGTPLTRVLIFAKGRAEFNNRLAMKR